MNTCDKSWVVTFLVTGFRCDNYNRLDGMRRRFMVGNVDFSDGELESLNEKDVLSKSSDFAKFPFKLDDFPRAKVTVTALNHFDAAMKGLFEINRTLDTLVFTPFGRSKCMNVGFVNDPNGDLIPIKYRGSEVQFPIINYGLTAMMDSVGYNLYIDYTRHFEHLLFKSPKDFTESEDRLVTSLRWCRLAALSTTTFDWLGVTFLFEWFALENLVKVDPRGETSAAFRRIPKIMKHFPLDIITNYAPELYTNLQANIGDLWWEKIQTLYEHGTRTTHEALLEVDIDRLNLFETDKNIDDTDVLEAIIGRLLPFIGEASRTKPTMKEVWELADSYTPDIDDSPPTNLKRSF